VIVAFLSPSTGDPFSKNVLNVISDDLISSVNCFSTNGSEYSEIPSTPKNINRRNQII